MAQRAADQITLTDLTDGVSVVLSSEAYAFPAGVTNAIAGSTTTKIQAVQGGEYVSASVNLASVVKPSGITVTSDGHATAPTLTISIASSVTAGGEVVIPVVVQGLTIEKRFSYSLAKAGQTGAQGVQGAKGDTGATGAAATVTGLLNEAQMIVTNASGVTPSASSINVGFYGYVGASRAAVTAAAGTLPAGLTVTTNTAGSSSTDGVLTLSVASGSNLGGGDSGVITITLTCNGVARPFAFSWSKAKTGMQGAQGEAGMAAVTVEVASSQGLVFKNTQVATTLTARVYLGGVEVTGSALAALGALKWYKDGSYLSGKDGSSLTITAGDVTDRATYEARLEY